MKIKNEQHIVDQTPLLNPVSLAKDIETNPNSIDMEKIQIVKKSTFQKGSTIASYSSKLKQFAIFNNLNIDPWPKSISAHTDYFNSIEIDLPKIER